MTPFPNVDSAYLAALDAEGRYTYVLSDPAEAMGPYSPEITQCPIATFEAHGSDACFA